MATKKGGSSKDSKGKKPHKNKLTSKKYECYKLSGNKVTRERKFCIKCGPGVFLAQHNNRKTCGKCGYTEFDSK
jgi:small subunit ribosomal protein S27Ae